MCCLTVISFLGYSHWYNYVTVQEYNSKTAARKKWYLNMWRKLDCYPNIIKAVAA